MPSQDLSGTAAHGARAEPAALSRLAGVGLLLLAYVPLHRLLDPAVTGPAGDSTRASADAAWTTGLFGTVIVAGLAFVAARLTAPGRPGRAAAPLLRALEQPGSIVFATGAGLVAFSLSGAIAGSVFGALPTSVDEMVQLLHARALVAGGLGLPTEGGEAAWAVQNGVFTAEGWASVYPPLHTVLLAVGLRLGAAWLVGPVAIGLATGVIALSLERLLERRLPARAAAALLAVSPFWLLLGATQLSHASAVAGVALVLWTALRARDGAAAWGVAIGASVGALVCTRPWTGIALSVTLLASILLPPLLRGERPASWGLRRAGLVVAGGAPFAAFLFWWNARLFGDPLTLGYSVAFGPAHGLGFHVDPWGNRYGALEALAYTGADMVQLGAHLFESPLPALALIGVALVVTRLPRGAGVLLAWAAGTAGANALYWHHGVHMGPRMAFEAAPAWVALFVLSAGAMTSSDSNLSARWRDLATWGVALALLGGAALAPATVGTRRATPLERGLATVPTLLDSSAIVFVHGSWPSRLAARLAASGMRRDSIETALRRNDICDVDRYARARSSQQGAEAVQLDLEPRSGSPAGLASRLLSPGNVVRVAPEREPDAVCMREAGADRLGIIELEPLLWQAPPLPNARFSIARDLGPDQNNALLRRLGRTPYLYADLGEGPRLLPYEEGMQLLWGGNAAPVGLLERR